MRAKATVQEFEDRLAEMEKVLAALRSSTERMSADGSSQQSGQQQALLLKLSDTIRALNDPDTIAATATRMVFDHFNVDRCFISRLAPEEQKAWLEHEVRKPHLASVEGEVNLDDFPDAMRTLETEALVLCNVADDPNLSELDKRSIGGLSAGSLLAAMLRKGERNCLWDIVLITETPRDWSADDVHLVEELAERVWTAMERASVEKALRASEKRSREAMQIAEQRAAELNAVIDSMTDAVYIGTIDGITQVNQAALVNLGFTEKELNRPVEVLAREIDVRDAETGDLISAEDQPFSRAFRGERTVRLVRARHRRTGEERVLRSASSPVMLNGKIIAAVAVNTDVTDQRKTEIALRQTEKLAAVGRLASSIAHEINNPLEAVINLIYLAHSEAISPVVAGYLEQAQSELARVSHITTETLRFHRQQSVPSYFDMVAIVESVLLLHEGRLRASQVDVERRYGPHPVVLGLANEIRQVVANLVGNALDAIQSNNNGERRLRLRVRQAVNPVTGAKGVRLTVSDTGSGISEASRLQVFQPFFTTKAATGTGLGLWVSAEIIRKHEGRLRFRSSKSKGYQGTVFSVLLSDMAATDEQPVG